MNTLENIIKDLIATSGPITFHDFMETALYHPACGYYSQPKDRVGASGDFYTSPATHPLFGTLIAIQLQQMWELLGSPSRFSIVETGAGKGLLARDILSYLTQLSPSFARSVQYITVEKQKITLLPNAPGFLSGESAEPFNDLPDKITGCLLSNEFIDALPTHKVTRREGRLWEVYVTVKEGSFREVLGPFSSPLLQEQLATEGIELGEGMVGEINLDALKWMRDGARRLEKGFVITVDYGYPAEQLYSADRKEGTVMTYFRHMAGDDPYKNVGEQDITSHVDFTGIILEGEKFGLQTLGLISQREFLHNLGFKAFFQALATKGLPYNKYMTNRFAMMELVRPEGFGDFKVLVQSKGVEKVRLFGLSPGNELVKTSLEKKSTLEPPLLDEEHIPLLEAKYPHLFIPTEADL